MAEDTFALVFKITLSSGEKRSHTYYNCPTDGEAFNKWFDEHMDSVFTKTGLRHWLKLKNPDVFYHVDHIASWEFEYPENEEFTLLLNNKTDFMLQIVGPG